MLQESLPSPKKSTVFSWMKLLADITVIVGVIVCMVLIIGYSVDLYRHGKQKIYIGWFSSAGFVLLTIPISLRIIVQHLTHWVAPNVQKYIVRIVWMVPIYAVESWIALRFKFMANYLEKLRESYEAYVIFCFMYYLIALLGGDEQQIAYKLRKHAADIGKQSWFSPLVGTKPTGSELLRRCKLGVFQYVIVKNVVAIVAMILESQGIQHEGDFSFDKPYIYQTFIANISQLWALYCLVVFYVATKDELSHWRPVGKFLCVKMVVFFTWWQSIFIEILFASPRGQIIANNTEDSWTVNEISKGLQDYVICIEMFFASIAFSMAFSYKDYDSYRAKKRLVKDGDRSLHHHTSEDRLHHDNEEDHSLLNSAASSAHGHGLSRSGSNEELYYYEADTEVKPFLSAFFQSAIPDDIVNDFRKLTRIGNLAWGRVSGTNSGSTHHYSHVESDDFYATPEKLAHRHADELSDGEHDHPLEEITIQDSKNSLPPVQIELPVLGTACNKSTPSSVTPPVAPLQLPPGQPAGIETSPRLTLGNKSMSFRIGGNGSGHNPSHPGGGLLSARKLPLEPDDAVVDFEDLEVSGGRGKITEDASEITSRTVDTHSVDAISDARSFAMPNDPSVTNDSSVSSSAVSNPKASTGWSFF